MRDAPTRRRHDNTRSSTSGDAGATTYELEFLPGLEDSVRAEVGERLAGRATIVALPRPSRMQIRYRGQPGPLSGLRSVVAVHLLLAFDVPRPKALLGHEHLTRLLAAIRDTVLGATPTGFASLRLSAAGSDSAVMQRFQAELGRALGLSSGDDQADLLVSLRRPADRSPGWEVLVRTTPRPLSARAWRVCNMPGALNATAAHAMARMLSGGAGRTVVNLACGSGTLLVEYLGYRRSGRAVGIDVSRDALDCARANLAAAGMGSDVLLLRGDATALPLAPRSVDALLVDLPYGMLVGSAESNERLYPALLREAARVATPRALLVAITASKHAFERALDGCPEEWQTREARVVTLPYKSGYMSPVIYLLARPAAAQAAGAHRRSRR
ncbi:MAG: methyltransferase domain-containing protein [Anaerolineae bacterium]